MSAPAITRHSTMGQVLEAYPSAQRALFRRYHMGGCNSCGYQPGDTLEEVAGRHNILDVDETPAEWELARIEGATLMTQAVAQVVMRWPKHTPIVFYCHLGQRSLDAASYYAGHGFTEVRSITGGLDAWSAEVDPSVSRYEVARDPSGGRASLRPLRSAVSEAEGCQSSEGAR